jgi:hypothetical protein
MGPVIHEEGGLWVIPRASSSWFERSLMTVGLVEGGDESSGKERSSDILIHE